VLEDLIRAWDGEEVVAHFDEPSGAWMFICLHSTGRGPAGGGTRLQVYPSAADALADAMRLAEGMTLKMSAADLPFGGGKAVLSVPILPTGEERRRLLLRYGDLVASLGGNYRTGPDVNTTSADMDVIGERTSHVFCRSEAHGGSGDPGPYTARGVFHGIRASLARVFGSGEARGRSVLVQGVGDVGARLAELLAEAGARVLVSDVAADRAATVAAGTGAEIVPPGEALRVACDVYAPCALGGTLSADSVRALGCRVVAGSANNQLAAPEDAERLRAAEILYVPDFVINAGGVLYAWGVESLGWSRDQVEERLVGIGDTLTAIYERAETEGITTAAAAEQLALARVRAGRPSNE
jgi:leucine dehydrogenase